MVFDSGVPGNAGDYYQQYDRGAQYYVGELHAGVGLRRGRRLA
jgi:hypothetical protein